MSIIMCNEKKILHKLSFGETIRNSKNLEVFFQQHIPMKSYISIYMTHNIHIPSVILSIKSCGHIFIPINVNYSDQEIQELVEEANIQYIVALKNIEQSFNYFTWISSIVIGSDELCLWKCEIEKKSCLIENSILCILPTSGTTGKRKLIKIESYCIEKNVRSLSKIFNLVEADVIYYGTPLSFDPSLVELFLALQSKATLLTVPEDVKLDPCRLFQTLFSRNNVFPRVTFLQMVPSLFTRWTEKQIQFILKESQLKILVLGGEPFPPKILEYERSIKLFNIYGITEISCWATIYEVKSDNNIYLGAPLEETSLKISDNGREVQNGIGELFIGSKTRHCYINDEKEHIEWRATGDLVENTCKGLKYLGRKDNRIKRLGYQIVLNKVEERILEKMGLTSKYIWNEKAFKLLLFILISSSDLTYKSKILEKLRVKLLNILQKHEFPDFIDVIPMFPVTQNGKLDTWTLSQIYEQNKIVQKTDQSSKLFLVIIAKYLGHSLRNISKLKNFTFGELGGTSILYTLVTNELKDTFKCELPSEFLSLLFNKSIGKCYTFLETFQDWNNCRNDVSEIEDYIPQVKKTKCSANVKILWKFNLFGCVDAAPLLFEKCGRTYIGVGSFSNFFAILDALTGEKKFLEQFPDSIGNEASVSPCLNYLYFGCFDGNLYCINLESYKVAWNYKSENSIKCKPCFCPNNKSLVFGSYDKHIHCIKFESGEVIWKTHIGESIVTTPIQQKEQILVTTLSGSILSISEKTGDLMWRIKLKNPIFSSSYFIKNILITCDVLGYLHFTDINSGNSFPEIELDGEIYASIKYTNDHLIISSSKGVLFKCKLVDNNTNCQIVDSLKLKNSITATPNIFETGKKIYIAVFTSEGHFYLIRFETFEIIFYWRCPGDIYSSCIFYQNKLYFGCRNDNLYCLDVTIL